MEERKMHTARNNHLFFTLCTISIITIASGFNYVGLRQCYWAAELPTFVFGALVFCFCLGLLLARGGGQIFQIGPIDIVFVLFYIYACLRSLAYAWPNPPTDQLYVPIGIIGFYIALRCNTGKGFIDILDRLPLWIIIIACFQAFFGISQALDILPSFHQEYKAAGSFINPGIYGCCIAIGLSLSIDHALRQTPKRKIFFCIIILALILALTLSRSRAAWVAAILAISFTVFARRPHLLKIGGPKIKWFLFLCGMPLTVGMLYLMLQADFPSVNGRMLIWKTAWQMFIDRPLFGWGYGAFYSMYGNFQSAYFLAGDASSEEIQTASMNYYAFNEPMKILVEQGIIGFIPAIIVVFLTLHFALKHPDKNGPDESLISFVAIVLVILVFGFFSYPFQDIFLNLAFTLSIAHIAARQSIKLPVFKVTTSKKILVFLFTVLLFFSFSCFEKIYGILIWKHAKENILTREGDALREYGKAYPILSNNGSFLFNYGAELADMGQYKTALRILERAKLYGNSVELHMEEARVLAALGEYRRAEDVYILAAHMNPKLFVPFFELFLFYRRSGQEKKAMEVARQLCDKPVKVPSPTIDKIKQMCTSYLKK